MRRCVLSGFLLLLAWGGGGLQAQERPDWSGKNVRLDSTKVERERLTLIIEQMVKAGEISAELGGHVRRLLEEQREMTRLYSHYGLLDPEALRGKIAEIKDVTHLRIFLFFTEAQKAAWKEWSGRIVARPVSGRLVIYDNPPGADRRR